MPKIIHHGKEIEIRMTWKYFFSKLKVCIIIEVLGHQPQHHLYLSIT